MDRAFRAMPKIAGPLRKGDLTSVIQHRIIDRVEYRDGHWVWTGGATRRHHRPTVTWPDLKRNGRTRSGSAFMAMMRVFFPQYGVRSTQRYRRTCDEVLCISPYHRERGVPTNPFTRTLSYEVVVRIYQCPPRSGSAVLAKELGITRSQINKIRAGVHYRDFYHRYHGMPSPAPYDSDRRLANGNSTGK